MRATLQGIDNSVLRQGILFGSILGAVHIVYALINNLANLDALGGTWLSNASFTIMFLLLTLAGFAGSRETGQVKTGALAGLATGLVSAVIGVASLWVITLLFMDTIRQNTFMIMDFQRSGSASMDAFIIEDALGASGVAIVVSLVLGSALGTLGGLLGARSVRLRVQH